MIPNLEGMIAYNPLSTAYAMQMLTSVINIKKYFILNLINEPIVEPLHATQNF